MFLIVSPRFLSKKAAITPSRGLFDALRLQLVHGRNVVSCSLHSCPDPCYLSLVNDRAEFYFFSLSSFLPYWVISGL